MTLLTLRLCGLLLPFAAVAMAGDANFRVTTGVIHAAAMEIIGFSLQDVAVVPTTEGSTIRLLDVTARAYGGQVSGWIALDLDPQRPAYRGDLKIQGMDLALLLRSHGLGAEGISGRVEASFAFHMPADQPTEVTGRGNISISEASLLQFSVLTNLLVGDPTARGQDSASATVAVMNGQLQVRSGRIDTAIGSIALRGTVSLDGALDLAAVPHPKGGIWQPIPVINWISVWATSRLGRYAIRGTLASPELRLNPFGDDPKR